MSRKFTGRPPPLSTHPSSRYWGRPPALVPPGHKGKGKGGRIVLSAPEESICDTIDHSNLRGILRDLCYWQSHVTTVEELAGKVTSADWYPLLLGKLAESVIVISGAPNVGKSSLAVHLAKTWVWCGQRLRAEISGCSLVVKDRIFPSGCIAPILSGVSRNHLGPGWDSLFRPSLQAKNLPLEQPSSKGTGFLLFRAMPTWPPRWFTWPLPTSFCLSEGRKLGRFESISFSCRTPWNNSKSSTRWSSWKAKSRRST